MPADSQRVDGILEVLVQLAAGDFEARAEVTGEGDNLDAVAAGINMLAEEIAARVAAVEHAAEELRRQVRERSRELADALAVAPESEPTPITVATIVDDRYQVVRKLGSGGMGSVHEVMRLTDGRRLALKTLHGRVDRGTMARFAREAQIATELSHPSLVPVVDLGVTPSGMMYLVMELVEGTTLEEERDRFGDRPWALKILAQVATGLLAIHERGIVHRDLKPANVLLSRGTARIADFGIASLRSDELAADAAAQTVQADAPALTQRGVIMGTLAYIAPELALGAKDARPAADIFSFGVMACEMLTGEEAFLEPPLVARLGGRPITRRASSPAEGPTSSTGVLLERCLLVEPAERPSSAELCDALAAWRERATG